jgi:hypothetical protein
VPVKPAEGDILTGDHDDAGARHSPLHPDRLDRRPWWRAGGPDATQQLHLLRGQRVGAGAEQLAGVQVVEHQGGRFDPDTDPAAAEDLRGQHDVLTQRHAAAAVDGPFDLDGVTVLDRGQRRRPRNGGGRPASLRIVADW